MDVNKYKVLLAAMVDKLDLIKAGVNTIVSTVGEVGQPWHRCCWHLAVNHPGVAMVI